MSDYKISLSTIPNDWKICRFKFCYNSKKEIVGDDFPLFERLALTLNGVIKRSKNDDKGLQPKDFKTYQILRKDDMVFKMIDLQNISTSRVGRTLWDGIVSPAYLRFEPLYKDPGFMYFYFMSLYYNNVFNNIAGDGVRSALNAFDIGNIYCAFPPLPIQNRIVETLDDKLGKIDALIENENKQIEKLDEYKKAVITKAVTKGLDSTVKMKYSGVEWIGMIPDEWSLNRIKFISLCNPESLSSNENMQLSINYVDIGLVSLNNGIEKTEFFKFSNAPSRARRILKKDDVIISTVRTYLKAIAVVDRDGLIGSTGFCVLRPLIDFINPAFLGYYCKSNVFTNEVSKRSVGISYPAINSLELISLYITYPSMAKQQQIADYLDEKCEKINRIIEIKKSKIEKLQTYKKSLIYEYVTGKKEVSNA